MRADMPQSHAQSAEPTLDADRARAASGNSINAKMLIPTPRSLLLAKKLLFNKKIFIRP
jgi:hypothetical protein